jgi:phospholipid-translocating ATPase
MTIDPIVAALPFFVIIALTSFKDGIEDLRRHKSDESINSQKVRVIGPPWTNKNAPFSRQGWELSQPFSHLSAAREASQSGQDAQNIDDRLWTEKTWGEISVGDIVLLRNDEGIPADIVILSTSEPDCLCYVETKNLDGETNLKIRSGVLETGFLHPDAGELIENLSLYVESEKPNASLYSFTGSAVVPSQPKHCIQSYSAHSSKINMNVQQQELLSKFLVGLESGFSIPLNINKILLRGCILRNTGWVIGLVAFTGSDTKICLNSGGTPSKQSGIEKKMNPQV